MQREQVVTGAGTASKDFKCSCEEMVRRREGFEDTMKTKPNMPQCPVCKTAKHVVKLAHHFCNHCKGTFDGDDLDEGGDYSNFNPAARLEREERQQANKQQRRQR